MVEIHRGTETREKVGLARFRFGLRAKPLLASPEIPRHYSYPFFSSKAAISPYTTKPHKGTSAFSQKGQHFDRINDFALPV